MDISSQVLIQRTKSFHCTIVTDVLRRSESCASQSVVCGIRSVSFYRSLLHIGLYISPASKKNSLHFGL